MITTSLLALALFVHPKRPAYALRTGDSYRYRYEIHRGDDVGTALIGVQVTKADRSGNAELAVTTEITTSGHEMAPGAPTSVPVDRWLYYRGKDQGIRPAWEAVIRIERPGTRPGATYALVPGEGATAVYEVREDSPETALVRHWRRTLVLDGDRLPVSAEVRSEFADGTAHTQTLTRLSAPERSH